MEKAEAEEVRELLLELLDERHEAGPTSYVVRRATVEQAEAGGWMLEVVIRPSLMAPNVELLYPDLGSPDGETLTPEELAWQVYRQLEGGAVTP